jgi:hypothetical protein
VNTFDATFGSDHAHAFESTLSRAAIIASSAGREPHWRHNRPLSNLVAWRATVMSRTVLHASDPPLRASAIFDTRRLKEGLRAAGPPLLFGFRLWASVCLALYVAFLLELDDASWAGTTAAIVCQPRLGASLRKGWFRMIGTPLGAVAIVVLTACFPQYRCLFAGMTATVQIGP